MRNLVKTSLDVGLQHPMISSGAIELDLGYRVLHPSVRAEPIRARLKVRLENRLKNCLQAQTSGTWVKIAVEVGQVLRLF
jgi:hypothetical protein